MLFAPSKIVSVPRISCVFDKSDTDITRDTPSFRDARTHLKKSYRKRRLLSLMMTKADRLVWTGSLEIDGITFGRAGVVGTWW